MRTQPGQAGIDPRGTICGCRFALSFLFKLLGKIGVKP
jgi:hypothetical protein